MAPRPEFAALDWKTAYESHMLWAWVVLALFGRAIAVERPQGARPPRWGGLAKVLLLLGVFPSFIFAALTVDTMTWLTIVSSAFLALAGLCLGGDLLDALSAKSPAGPKAIDVSHLFFLSALNWLVLSAVADIAIQIRQYGQPGPTLEIQTVLFSVLILGFAGNLILGVATRALPPRLACGRLRDRAWLVAGLLWNGGLLVALLASWIGPTAAVTGFLIMIGTAGFFILGLDFLRTAPHETPTPTAKGLTVWAFLALVSGLVLLAAPKTGLLEIAWTRFVFYDTAKHLLMAGFLGLLIWAIAGPPNRLAAIVLVAGLILRTAGPFVPSSSSLWPNTALAAGALLELFAWILWATTQALRIRHSPKSA